MTDRSPPHLDYDGASVPELRHAMDDKAYEARADAACALGDRLRTRELLELDANTHERLAELLGDEHGLVQLEAAIALAELGDARALPVLQRALARRETRLDATRALGTLGHREAEPQLERILNSWLMPWADRLQAAAALCALGAAKGTHYLESKLKSRRRPERAAAIHFLGESRHPQARTLLEKILLDPSDPMRDVAARSLGVLRAVESTPTLERVLHEATGEFRQDIEESLQVLARVRARAP